MLSTTFTDDLFMYVTWMLLGILAFGFGIMYMNRLGDADTLYAQAPLAEVAEKVYESEETEEEAVEVVEAEGEVDEAAEEEEAVEESSEEEKGLLALATEVDLELPGSQGVGMSAAVVMAAAQQQGVRQGIARTAVQGRDDREGLRYRMPPLSTLPLGEGR